MTNGERLRGISVLLLVQELEDAGLNELVAAILRFIDADAVVIVDAEQREHTVDENGRV